MSSFFRSTYGSRTRPSSVKGRRRNRLTNAPFPFGIAKIQLDFKLPNLFQKNYTYFYLDCVLIN